MNTEKTLANLNRLHAASILRGITLLGLRSAKSLSEAGSSALTVFCGLTESYIARVSYPWTFDLDPKTQKIRLMILKPEPEKEEEETRAKSAQEGAGED